MASPLFPFPVPSPSSLALLPSVPISHCSSFGQCSLCCHESTYQRILPHALHLSPNSALPQTHKKLHRESHPSHPLGPGVPSFSGFTGLPSQRRLSFSGATVYSGIFLQTSGSVFSFYHIHVCLVLGYFTRCDHLEIDWSRRFLFEQQQQVSKSSPFF